VSDLGTARRPARVALGVALGVAALGACVRITSEPGGIASVRLDPVLPAIIVGDTLRDSLGNAVRLRAVAFDSRDDQVAEAPFRYGQTPLGTNASGDPTAFALRVDSLTGLVVASPTFVAPQARVTARLGNRLQLVDTVDVVPRPDSLGVAPAVVPTQRLAFLCTDDQRATFNVPLVATDTVNRLGNASRPLPARLSGDSVPGRRVGIRRYLVRYAVDAGRPIPVGTSPYGDQRPALHFVNGTTDTRIGFDTTQADGTTRARLRVLPTLLTRAAFPSDTIPVRVVATAIVPGRTGPAPLGTRAEFTVTLVRTAPPNQTVAQGCP
jgi:hypothetical protein